MSNSVETVLEKGEQAFNMLMLSGDADLTMKLMANSLDEFTDAVYDYLADPDQTEIKMLQAQLAPMAAIFANNPLEQFTKGQSAIPNEAQPMIKDFMLALSKQSGNMTTPRLKKAFEAASKGVSLKQHSATNIARMEHAITTDTFNELLAMNNMNSNKMVSALAQNGVAFLASDKLAPFMQALSKNLDKDDFKTALGYMVKTGFTVFAAITQMQAEIENALDGVDPSTQLGKLAGLQASATTSFLSAVTSVATPKENGAKTFKRIFQGVEDSLIESGAVSEADYIDFFKKHNENILKTMRGYDAMNDFDATKSLAARTSRRHGGPKAPK